MRIFYKKTLWVVFLNTLFLTACSDVQQPKPATQIAVTTKYTETSVLLSGKVSTRDKVEAVDSNQNIIASTVVKNGRYQLEIPAQTKFPIVLQAGNFISVVVDVDVTHYDINSFTTHLAAQAKSLGGYTRKNMILAASNSVHTPDENKTSTGFRGDPTSQYGGWH